MNPFILAGLVLTGVGLLQEAKDADKTQPKVITGPPGKDGKDGKVTVIEKTVEKKKPKLDKPTDG